MSILSRIRANGGEVIRSEWRFALRPGRLSVDAIAWVKTRWPEVRLEAWPDFGRWEERAAIKEYDAGMTRADAEAEAYREIAGC